MVIAITSKKGFVFRHVQHNKEIFPDSFSILTEVKDFTFPADGVHLSGRDEKIYKNPLDIPPGGRYILAVFYGYVSFGGRERKRK
jgi:hypothetical protein